MANQINTLSLANTFSEWLGATGQLVVENNTLGKGNYTKDSGLLTLSGSGTGLSVANNSLFAGNVVLSGTSSNTLQVTANASFGGTVFATRALTNQVTSNSAVINFMTANNLVFTNLISSNATIDNSALNVARINTAAINVATVNTGTVTVLNSTNSTLSDTFIITGRISTALTNSLTSNSATLTNAYLDVANIGTSTQNNSTVNNATITSLTSTGATITNGLITNLVAPTVNSDVLVANAATILSSFTTTGTINNAQLNIARANVSFQNVVSSNTSFLDVTTVNTATINIENVNTSIQRVTNITVGANVNIANANTLNVTSNATIKFVDMPDIRIRQNTTATDGNEAILIGKNLPLVSTGATSGGARKGGIAIGSYVASADTLKANQISIGYLSGTGGSGGFNETLAGEESVFIGVKSGNTVLGGRNVGVGPNAGYRQEIDCVAIGANTAGNTASTGNRQYQGAIAIGRHAGYTNQGANSIAIGINAGSNNQGVYAIALGYQSAETQQENYGVAIGFKAAENYQDQHGIAIGTEAGRIQRFAGVALGIYAGTEQGQYSVAIGGGAGQKSNAATIAIGTNAGKGSSGSGYQGNNSIAIGSYAARSGQVANSIAINGSGQDQLNWANNSGLFINPVRQDSSNTANIVFYNASTKEFTYADLGALGTGNANTYGYLNNSVLFANSTGYASNTTNLQFFTSNTTFVSGNTQIRHAIGVGTTPDTANVGSIRAIHNIVAYYSDERLKTKLGNIDDAVDKVMTLNGFYYEPNEVAQSLGYKPAKEVGLSAQEVQRILPEVISTAPISDEYLTIRYERIIPLLVEAIKELKAEIEELKKGK